MLKDNITCASQKCWICRLIFLACLAFFVLSPIADAYSDSLCPPLVFLNGQNDADDPVITAELNLSDNVNSVHAIKASGNISQNYHAFLQASIKHVPICLIENIQLSANNIKSSQICQPLSSDPSPPVI
jgi:hypothetical protein